MNLTVSKDQVAIGHVDLEKEIMGVTGPASFFIGRASDCHVHLDDKQISRQQAKLTFKNHEWSLENLSELQQVLINGQAFHHAQLKNGDVIQIGSYTIRLKIDESTSLNGEAIVGDVSQNQNQEQSDNLTQTTHHTTIQNDSLETVETANEFREFKPGMPGADENSSDDAPFTDDLVKELHQNEAHTFLDGENKETDFPDNKDDDFELSEIDGRELGEQLEAEEFGEVGDVAEVAEASGEFGDYSERGELTEYDDDVGDKTQVVGAFATYQLEVFGEFAPYDRFLVEKKETIIGRDPKSCDIILNDPEVSSKHAKIVKNNIFLVLEDLQSGNGTLLNGVRINRANLTENDEFIIGSTTFTVKVVSELLEGQDHRLMPVEENQEIEVEEIVEVDEGFEGEEGHLLGDESSEGPENKSLIAKWKNMDPQKRKKLMIYAVGLLVLWVVLDEEEPPPPPPKPKEETKKEDPQVLSKQKTQRVLKPEEIEFLEAQYILSNALFEQGKYAETNIELEKMFTIVPDYKNAKQLYDLSKTGLARIEELERKRQEEIDRQIRLEKVKLLVERAKKATDERKSEVAESLFSEILSLDPENYDVPQFRMELDAWKRELERKKLEEEMKKAERQRMVDSLAPGKTLYLKKDWYKAILRLEEFLTKPNMDEDLVTDATQMLSESKKNLDGIIGPLLGRARSLVEGQDLKGAYENYGQILRYDPTHTEAIREMADIRERLFLRAKKIYREGIISESLSLFEDAKEKFQEVQQVSPSDSEYYEKATERLKRYID